MSSYEAKLKEHGALKGTSVMKIIQPANWLANVTLLN